MKKSLQAWVRRGYLLIRYPREKVQDSKDCKKQVRVPSCSYKGQEGKNSRSVERVKPGAAGLGWLWAVGRARDGEESKLV